MNSKIILLLSIYLISFKVQCGVVKDVEPQDIWDDCQTLLNQLTDVVEVAFSEALPLVELIPGEIVSLGQTTITLVKTEIKRRIDEYSKTLAELEIDAINVGKPECTLGKQQDLDRIEGIVVGAIDDCVLSNVETSLELVEKSLNELINSLEIIGQYEAEVQSCKTNNDEVCANRVKQTIEVEIVEAPIRIQAIADSAVNVRDSLKSATQACGTDRISLVISLGNSVIDGVRRCLLS